MTEFDNKPVKLLTGGIGTREFDVYIENADKEKELKIKANSDIEIHFLKKCAMSH